MTDLSEPRPTGAGTTELFSDYGGRFEEDPPMLAWICFHVLQAVRGR